MAGGTAGAGDSDRFGLGAQGLSVDIPGREQSSLGLPSFVLSLGI